MKTATLFAALAATAVASPLSKRGVTENEVENGECRTYTFIFARGSTEIGNMVRPFPQVSPALIVLRPDQIMRLGRNCWTSHLQLSLIHI